MAVGRTPLCGGAEDFLVWRRGGFPDTYPYTTLAINLVVWILVVGFFVQIPTYFPSPFHEQVLQLLIYEYIQCSFTRLLC